MRGRGCHLACSSLPPIFPHHPISLHRAITEIHRGKSLRTRHRLFHVRNIRLHSCTLYRMLPLLVRHVSLETRDSEAKDSDDYRDEDPDHCCHQHVSSTALSLEPVLQSGSRFWILQFLVELCQSIAEVGVRKYRVIMPIMIPGFESQEIIVETVFRNKRRQKRLRLTI